MRQISYNIMIMSSYDVKERDHGKFQISENNHFIYNNSKTAWNTYYMFDDAILDLGVCTNMVF